MEKPQRITASKGKNCLFPVNFSGHAHGARKVKPAYIQQCISLSAFGESTTLGNPSADHRLNRVISIKYMKNRVFFSMGESMRADEFTLFAEGESPSPTKANRENNMHKKSHA